MSSIQECRGQLIWVKLAHRSFSPVSLKAGPNVTSSPELSPRQEISHQHKVLSKRQPVNGLNYEKFSQYLFEILSGRLQNEN